MKHVELTKFDRDLSHIHLQFILGTRSFDGRNISFVNQGNFELQVNLYCVHQMHFCDSVQVLEWKEMHLFNALVKRQIFVQTTTKQLKITLLNVVVVSI